MGHIGADKSSLVPLIDRLNRHPVGLVDNEILREILALLFSEQEAFVASRFPLEEATLPELCRLSNMEPETLLPVLETMADKGLVMDLPYGGDTYYLLIPGLIGFFEFTFMKHRVYLPLEKVVHKGRNHINAIEGFWCYAKHWLYQYRGVSKNHFPLYLKEIEWRVPLTTAGFNNCDSNLVPLLSKMHEQPFPSYS